MLIIKAGINSILCVTLIFQKPFLSSTKLIFKLWFRVALKFLSFHLGEGEFYICPLIIDIMSHNLGISFQSFFSSKALISSYTNTHTHTQLVFLQKFESHRLKFYSLYSLFNIKLYLSLSLNGLQYPMIVL